MIVKNINSLQSSSDGRNRIKNEHFKGNAISQLCRGLKKGSVSKTDFSAFVLTSISGGCYLVGGSGLLYDFAHQKMNTKGKPAENIFKDIKLTKNKEKKKTEGAQTIIPETQFAKTGMKFARAAVALAGVAGVFNGVALNLPLLAMGEGVTSLSAPIIETPIGTGIFGFGLAMINLARVLDSNPEFKINRDKFNRATKKDKAKILINNLTHTTKELGHSTKTIFKNLFGIFSSKHKESIRFFKDKMFSFKPMAIVLQEQLTKEGKVILNKVPINNPYLMHAAALGLSVSSLALIGSNLLKQRKAEEVSLRGYGVSNGIDNVALSKWGVERLTSSNNLSGKMTGGAFTVAGLSLLTGQAGIDKNWGRGLMWNGVGIILLGFSAQTGAQVLSALKRKSINPVVAREWSLSFKNKVINSALIKKAETELAKIFKENSLYNKNSDSVLAQIKTTLSKVDGLEDIEIKKISDSHNIDEIKADMIKREQKYYS